ncbi:beta-ketoacyl-ACP reductase-like protein [Leptotrombidium deliense]|uniref:Beta-ketoacyl-ACP reductase-like protein n=1 Tax=Leptotrombidium deliense TaxID=299467 RepID=A0A443S4K8_9ACAR|nr:beta-ketoacyl-ACP reductase-like protein [Leptotrombidium deliense]
MFLARTRSLLQLCHLFAPYLIESKVQAALDLVSLCRTPAFVNYGFSNEQEFLDWSKSVVCDYPLGRIGEAIDYAECIAFLASPKASYITGSNIAVDGGALIVPNPFNKESNFV